MRSCCGRRLAFQIIVLMSLSASALSAKNDAQKAMIAILKETHLDLEVTCPFPDPKTERFQVEKLKRVNHGESYYFQFITDRYQSANHYCKMKWRSNRAGTECGRGTFLVYNQTIAELCEPTDDDVRIVDLLCIWHVRKTDVRLRGQSITYYWDDDEDEDESNALCQIL